MPFWETLCSRIKTVLMDCEHLITGRQQIVFYCTPVAVCRILFYKKRHFLAHRSISGTFAFSNRSVSLNIPDW